MILDQVGGRATSLRDGLKFYIILDQVRLKIYMILDQVGGRATSLRDGLKIYMILNRVGWKFLPLSFLRGSEIESDIV